VKANSRIPPLSEPTFDGALLWFSQLSIADLLFHPEDDPDTIVSIKDGTKFFSAEEVLLINAVLDQLESSIGYEKINEAAYPIFMNAMGIKLDS